MKNILYYEWILFLRNRFMLSSWILMLLIGMYALYYGRSFEQRQLQTIISLDTAYQNRIQKQINSFSADTTTKEGKSAFENAHDPFMNEYYTHPIIYKMPSALQALSIGQSDNQPFYNNLWLYGDHIYTENQMELRNPDKLLSGNFDLAFVTVYLLPLLIIAFSYGVASDDRETGISALLLSQGMLIRKLSIIRLLFRFFIVAALVILLHTVGFIANGVTCLPTIFYWLATNLLYITFWFSLVYAVVCLQKDSALTALLLVSTWVLFLLVIPSAINNTSKVKDAERVELSDAQREYSIHIWSLWQAKTAQLQDTLFLVKPEWKSYPIKDTETVNSVAYSYLDMLYMNRKGYALDSMVLQEQYRLDQFNYLNPAYTAQQTLNLLAGTESNSYINYRKAAAAYQKQRSEVVNELRLSDKPFTIADFKAYPVFIQPAYGLTIWQWMLQVMPLIMATGISILVGKLKSSNL